MTPDHENGKSSPDPPQPPKKINSDDNKPGPSGALSLWLDKNNPPDIYS